MLLDQWCHLCQGAELTQICKGGGQYLGDLNASRGGSCPYPGEKDFSLKNLVGVWLWLLSGRKDIHPTMVQLL